MKFQFVRTFWGKFFFIFSSALIYSSQLLADDTNEVQILKNPQSLLRGCDPQQSSNLIGATQFCFPSLAEAALVDRIAEVYKEEESLIESLKQGGKLDWNFDRISKHKLNNSNIKCAVQISNLLLKRVEYFNSTDSNINQAQSSIDGEADSALAWANVIVFSKDVSEAQIGFVPDADTKAQHRRVILLPQSEKLCDQKQKIIEHLAKANKKFNDYFKSENFDKEVAPLLDNLDRSFAIINGPKGHLSCIALGKEPLRGQQNVVSIKKRAGFIVYSEANPPDLSGDKKFHTQANGVWLVNKAGAPEFLSSKELDKIDRAVEKKSRIEIKKNAKVGLGKGEGEFIFTFGKVDFDKFMLLKKNYPDVSMEMISDIRTSLYADRQMILLLHEGETTPNRLSVYNYRTDRVSEFPFNLPESIEFDPVTNSLICLNPDCINSYNEFSVGPSIKGITFPTFHIPDTVKVP